MENQKIKVLHLEDDVAFAETTRFLLGCNYEVKTLRTTASALEEVEVFQPDVILLDLELPENLSSDRSEEGLALLARLKQTQHRSIPVIVITSHICSALRRKSLDLGALEFFTKPVQIESLTQVIASCLTLHKSEALITHNNFTTGELP